MPFSHVATAVEDPVLAEEAVDDDDGDNDDDDNDEECALEGREM